VRAKAGYTGLEFETPLAYVWTFRDGKIVHFKSYLDPAEAIEAARLRS
jgi:ketosteroid isomerase-like protein